MLRGSMVQTSRMQSQLLSRRAAPARVSAFRSAAPTRIRVVQCRAQTTTSKVDHPWWTGDGALSLIVNWIIKTPAVYSLLKVMAKGAMIRSAAKRGVEWEKYVRDHQTHLATYEAIKKEVEDPNFNYPEYCLKPIHGYDEGNLCWLAAFEIDPANYAWCLRTSNNKFPDLDAKQIYHKMRDGQHDAVQQFLKDAKIEPSTIIDMGCSTGETARMLAELYPQAQVTGIDLSPYMLALAEYEERQAAPKHRKRIHYVHKLAEASGLPDASCDVVFFGFVAREVPSVIMRAFIKEAARILRPGGALIFADDNQGSKYIQAMRPAVFSLMKSTEPYIDEYYNFDLPAALVAGGFTNVETRPSDHRRKLVVGTLPV